MRFKFTKLGELRFIGHLDMQTLLTRAARRAGLVLAYSNGFNPQPKLNLAAPLPLFQESVAEIGEMELSELLTPAQFMSRINDKLPPEVQLTEAFDLQINKKDSLSSKLSGAVYHATICGVDVEACGQTVASLKAEIDARVREILQAPTFIIQAPAEHDAKNDGRAKKPVEKDLRPLIKDIQLIDQDPLTLELKLAHGPRGHIKPTDILSNLGLPKALTNAPVRWKLKRIALQADNDSDLFAI
jgi:radical SAM-linked protein